MVEEGEGRVSFVQAGQRVFFGVGDVFEKSADVAGGKIARVAFVVKEHETERPVGAAFAGAVLTEALARHVADEVEQARRRRSKGVGNAWRGHGKTPEGLRDEGKCTHEQNPEQGKNEMIGRTWFVLDGEQACKWNVEFPVVQCQRLSPAPGR